MRGPRFSAAATVLALMAAGSLGAAAGPEVYRSRMEPPERAHNQPRPVEWPVEPEQEHNRALRRQQARAEKARKP